MICPSYRTKSNRPCADPLTGGAAVALELKPLYAEAAKKRQGARNDLKPTNLVVDLP
jgi:hypothetical protein